MHIRIVIFTLAILFSSIQLAVSQTVGGGFESNPVNLPCLSSGDYDYFHEMVALNRAFLNANHTRVASQASFGDNTVSFIWPVKEVEDSPYHSSWAISNYVDHDPVVGAVSDWNCGERTYDTAGDYHHQGLDIFTWPFWWKQMDEDQTEIIAAASGQIIYKNDGSFDRNCDFNSDLWNAVYIEHEDGSVAWYGHLKNGSITSKNVGDTVVQGEYLGIIGSSGNSTGPHLHFEVYDAANNLIDPYAGPCNVLNTDSLWVDQKPYFNPAINAVLTHTAIPDFSTCPETEETFESDQFDPNDVVWFGSYFKDQQPGTTALNEVFAPSGDLYTSWDNTFDTYYPASWWVQQFSLNTEEGTWIYRVTYNGESVDHTFNVGQLSIEEEEFSGLKAYPNPTQNQIQIASSIPMEYIEIRNITGKLLLLQNSINATNSIINMNTYAAGVYFVSAKALDEEGLETIRVVKL